MRCRTGIPPRPLAEGSDAPAGGNGAGLGRLSRTVRRRAHAPFRKFLKCSIYRRDGNPRGLLCRGFPGDHDGTRMAPWRWLPWTRQAV
ncbi:conserved hypothetical protein [Rhodospirillum centenum SW]|uniref:Uncharacterized protein n=1 Tax=Rhodospirillum centenum (strain ATCC 51521 / SW) TaxID=414684 RepID=B6ISP1_RHOCS|nr:conserved hypothetical protein [Rhodospirillum centenum SW]